MALEKKLSRNFYVKKRCLTVAKTATYELCNSKDGQTTYEIEAYYLQEDFQDSSLRRNNWTQA